MWSPSSSAWTASLRKRISIESALGLVYRSSGQDARAALFLPHSCIGLNEQYCPGRLTSWVVVLGLTHLSCRVFLFKLAAFHHSPPAFRNPPPIMSDNRKPFPFSEFEPAWQARWESEKTFRTPGPGETNFDPAKPKYYVIDMFPYPSG